MSSFIPLQKPHTSPKTAHHPSPDISTPKNHHNATPYCFSPHSASQSTPASYHVHSPAFPFEFYSFLPSRSVPTSHSSSYPPRHCSSSCIKSCSSSDSSNGEAGHRICSGSRFLTCWPVTKSLDRGLLPRLLEWAYLAMVSCFFAIIFFTWSLPHTAPRLCLLNVFRMFLSSCFRCWNYPLLFDHYFNL